MHIPKKENDESNVESESINEIVEKIGSGIYHVVRNKNQNKWSHVWDIFHCIAQEDGTELQSRLYCIRCCRVLTSRWMATSNLRRHKCFLQYLQEIGMSDSHRYEDDDEDITAERRETHVGNRMIRNMERHTAAKRRRCSHHEQSQHSSCNPQTVKRHNNTASSTDDEAEIFAKAWAQSYRKLSETQKLYAKRGIDEIFVLARLERLTLNTVTVLTGDK